MSLSLRPNLTPLALALCLPSAVLALINSPFKLRKASKDREHQAAMRRCGISPRIGQRFETRASLPYLIKAVEEVLG